MLKLKAQKRNMDENLSALRKSGLLPAVFYGAKNPSTPISINEKDFAKIWKEAGESSTVTIEFDGKNITTLIHEVQAEPVKDIPIHVDFLAIDINKAIRVNVPIEFVGEAPAVKKSLGILVKVMHEIEVEALPKDLPHNIEVDVSGLDTLESQISVADLKLPAGVTVIAKPEEVVAAISAMKEEKEEVPVDLDAIEVEKKGKKDLPADEAGEAAAPKKEE